MDKMLNMMMKRYWIFAWLGLVIVLFAFWQAFSVANANSVFFSADKATREAAGAGAVLVNANAIRHSLAIWVPAVKFLGLGLLLGAITMALGLIVQTLRDLGSGVMAFWPEQLNPGMPSKPRAAKAFPMLMMMGWLLLIGGVIWAFSLSGTASQYWAHSIANELNPAQPGSLLLSQLGAITRTLPWLNAIRFLGMTLLFTAITVALSVVIRMLQFQESALRNFAQASGADG